MKTFKEYRKNKNKLQSMETSFGSHSIQESEYKVLSDEEQAEIHQKLKLDKTNIDPKNIGDITKYTDSSYGLNSYLHATRNGHDTSTQTMNRDWANRLTDTLSKQSTKEPYDVYTGINHSPAKYFTSQKELGPVQVHLPAFTSTSTKRRTASLFSRRSQDPNDSKHGVKSEADVKHIIKIHMPTGTQAASVMPYSFSAHEHEVLLNRGHNIEVDPIPEHIGNNTYQWNAKIVGHTPDKL